MGLRKPGGGSGKGWSPAPNDKTPIIKCATCKRTFSNQVALGNHKCERGF